MWIIEPPSSTIRRASAAYSSGVYGIAGHWSRLATAPEIEQVRMTGFMASRTSYSSLCRIAGRRAQSAMIGAIILGIVAGFVGRLLMPGKDPMGFFATILLGLAGSVVGFLVFTELLGIGDNDVFDLGGLIGAIIGDRSCSGSIAAAAPDEPPATAPDPERLLLAPARARRRRTAAGRERAGRAANFALIRQGRYTTPVQMRADRLRRPAPPHPAEVRP